MEAALTQPTGRRGGEGERGGGVGHGQPPRWRSDVLLRTGARRHVTTAERAGWLVAHTRCDATDAADWPAPRGGLAYVRAHARAQTQARPPTGPRTVAGCALVVGSWGGGGGGGGRALVRRSRTTWPCGERASSGGWAHRVGQAGKKGAPPGAGAREKKKKDERAGEIPSSSPRGAPAGRVGGAPLAVSSALGRNSAHKSGPARSRARNRCKADTHSSTAKS